MLDNPLQDTSMCQTGDNDKQNANSDNGGWTESGECLLGVKYACDKKNGNGSEKYQVGAQLSE